ncbi:hypothetical protein BVX94_03930, partial [bacterium B17]
NKPYQPEISELYYWARTLRVLYGMAVLLICFYAARKVDFSHSLSLLAVALLSLAPVSIAITHSATGDIGVDLFLSAAIFILSFHAGKQSRGLLFAAGFLVGFAFAAKYHGALGCLLIAMYCTFRLCLKQVNLKQFIVDGLVTFLGFIISIHIAIPQLVTAGDRTWSDIFKNFTFIKNYNIDSEILEKTALEQAWLGITRNTPYLISNFGPALMLLAAVGAVLITIKLFREAREEKAPQRVDPYTPLLAAVIIFPFLASLISLLGKGKIQAFHFSYTLLPFILAACYCIKRMCSAKNAYFKAAAALLIIMSLAQTLPASLNEHFFWRKDDTEQLAHVFAKNVLHSTPSHISARITAAASRNFDLENFNPSTFRNRDRGVIFASSPFWNKIEAAPAPCVPFPYETDWIFTEGPTFPRNDRMFMIRPGNTDTKHIIMHSKPENITLGIRTGSLPALLEISAGKKKQKTKIEPDSQEILTMEAGKWKHIAPRKAFTELDRDIYL